MPRHFLQVFDLTRESLQELLERAQSLEAAFHAREVPCLLEGKRIALSFEDGGFRNHVAFELGIRLMGGEAIFVPGRPGDRESASDIVRYLSNWFDAVVIRTPEYGVVEELAKFATVPVINARTRYNHPCEILGDLAYVCRHRGNLDELKVVFVGERTNLCHSWFEAGVSLPIEVVQVCPRGYEVEADTYTRLAKRAVGRLRISYNLNQELKDADVVYTDCWPTRNAPQDAAEIEKVFAPYRVTAALLELTPAACVFLPCPPVTRGEEVSEDAMESPRCKVYQAKDYLLHAQNALLAVLLT
jgi:ornithine carbamoyltransferase